MVDLDFVMQGVKVERFAAAPTLLFALQVANRTPALLVHAVMLNCQIRIEPARRLYSALEHEQLSDLFSEPGGWSPPPPSFLWTRCGVVVPAFERECVIDLPVPCSYDFNIAATRYFYGVDDGEVPLNLLFNGSVFYGEADGIPQIGQIAWSRESAYRLPIRVWRDMMEHYYPRSAWLCLRREVFDQLHRYKRKRGLPSYERALEELVSDKLAQASPADPSAIRRPN